MFLDMKNKIVLYTILLGSAFTLQSCVSNYTTAMATQSPMLAPMTSLETISEDNRMVEVRESFGEKEEKPVVLKSDNTEVLAFIKKEMKKSNLIDDILKEADSYIGTRYKFGGMTRSGIDCSAFVLSVFGATTDIKLPRVSSAQAQHGERIEKMNLEKGDLLFFNTSGSRISHVGIVHDVTPEGEVKFIHASSSKGVTVSSLNEKYWGARYRFAKRVITEEHLGDVL